VAKGKTKAHKGVRKKSRYFSSEKTKKRDGEPRARRLPRPKPFDHTKPLPHVPIPPAVTLDILDKKELLVAPEFANHLILRYLRKQPLLIPQLNKPHFLRSAQYESMKKWVRQELRVLVGMFVLEPHLQHLLGERTTTILESHQSTKERLSYYPELYEKLFAGHTPHTVLDICAGLNPCSYEYLGCEPRYIAIDVSPQLMTFVQQWFESHRINGHAYHADITKLAAFPQADTVFIFKGTDVLERVRYGFGEVLLEKLFVDGASRVIVSFSTKTMGGVRDIAVSKRSWVERWAEQHGKAVRVVDIPGERFYVLENNI
jgi:hypothetical protein